MLQTVTAATNGYHAQIEAMTRLSEQKIIDVVPLLLPFLTSPDAVVRYTTVESLGELADASIGIYLLPLLNDEEDIVRAVTIEVVGQLHYKPALKTLIGMVTSEDEPLVLASVAEVLGDLGDQSGIKPLQTLLAHEDEAVRAYAANSLGLLGQTELIAFLKEAAHQEAQPRVKAELWGAAYRLGATDCLAGILDLLESADEPLATPILNMFQDMAERQHPPTWQQDAPHIRTSLQKIARKLPIVKHHAQQLIDQMKAAL